MVVAIRAWKIFHGESGAPLSGQRCIEIRFHSARASTSLGTTLVTDYVNFEHKCRLTAWLARVTGRSNSADQPSRQIFLQPGYVMQKGMQLSCQFSPWFARVANHSNPSDEPSRMNFEAPGLRQASKVESLQSWSCQSTSRSGESSGALTLSIKSLRVNV